MAIEKWKPFDLKITYIADIAPSPLVPPFSLQVKSLGVPETEIPVTQYINTLAFLSEVFGTGKLVFSQFARPVGLSAPTTPTPKIENLTRYIRATGFNASAFSNNTQIVNFHKNVNLSGFNTSLYGRPIIYNLRQYLLVPGRSMGIYGTAYVQGGVKEVRGSGFNSAVLPQPKVINTRADQYVDLRTPSRGIAPPTIDRPNVSPRILYPMGILPGAFGTAWVQRNPSPKGFTTDLYGTAWISHSPRYLAPGKVDAFNPGYPKIFDPTQRIYHAGSPHIPGGIFGDIAIRNARRLIRVPGSDQALYGDWSNVFSNLTQVRVQSFDAAVFGNNTIWNKTPSVIPGAWDSATFGNTFISERIRRINARGIDWPESQRFGKHVLTKPPEIKLAGFNAMRFGEPWVSNKTREIPPPGMNTLRFSEPLVWFRYRHLSATGIGIPGFAQPKVEHGLRFILGRGDSHLRFGSPTVWFRVRKLIPSSIYREFESKHLIGGTQHIRHSGFVATQFGERIVPENHAVYPLGFNGQAFSEKNQIELHTRWVRATGFLTFGTQTSDRYGTSRAWNKRQYIQHNYDSGDGLNPGEFGQWTAIANRNRVIGTQGFTATRYGYSAIDNNARLLKPEAMLMTVFGKPMIADRVRYLRLEGMEAPYMSGWGRVHNSAFVIAPVSGKHDQWGNAALVNTRRQYRWVGAFDSMVFGQPMIAFRIRKLSLENRYSIYQPSMPLPKVDLYTRYIDPPGPDLSAFGGPSLHIKWNTFTPRWTHRDYFGEPVVRNVTPELKQRGNVTEEMGKPSIRLHKQYLPVDGYVSELWGKTVIAFRNRSMKVNGNNYMAFGLHRVVKTGAPPYSLQTISLDWAEEGERPDNYEGKGIAIPERQVSIPSLKTNVIFTEGFVATQIGVHHTQSNGILVQPGIQQFGIGNHSVGLKNRTLAVAAIPPNTEVGWPRLNPHTIYAVMESSGQARRNHPATASLHYVNSDGGNRVPGEVFGRTTITLRHRTVGMFGINQSTVERPTVALKRRYIQPNGIQSFRMGWHFLSDGSPRELQQFDSSDNALYGRPTVTSPYFGPRYIRPGGFNAVAFGNNWIEHFHRTVKANGFNALAMGAGRSGDTPYKPQGLWIGPEMPTIPKGFASELFGTTWISNKVRDISADGFDSLSNDWDISNFGQRLKVTKVKRPVIIEQKEVTSLPFSHTAYGVPNIRLKVHYIRPDGNSDQYRKGGPT